MFLHEDGCICPKPQFAKHNKGPKQQKAGTDQSTYMLSLYRDQVFHMLSYSRIYPFLKIGSSSDLSMTIPGGGVEKV